MIELLFALAFWPWVLVLALFAGLSVSAYSETTTIAIVTTILVGGIAWFIYGVNPIAIISANPIQTASIIGMYIAAGILWSLYKWRLRLTSPELQSQMKSAKDRFVKEAPENKDPHAYLESYLFPSDATASKNKDRIMNWIALWPLSMLMYIIGDLLADLFNAIYAMVSGVYVRVTKHYAP